MRSPVPPRRVLTLLLSASLLLAPLALAESGNGNGRDDGNGNPWVHYNVGFLDEPPVERGDRFHGAQVRDVNDAIDTAHVRTKDPHRFEGDARDDPRVAYVERDLPDAVRPQLTPNDPRVSEQWAWKDTAPGIDATTAWDTTLGSTAVTVAVIDSGLDKSHEDIGNTLQGYDFANDDTTPEDDCDHGTHVSGTVGALTDNGVGVAGTAQTIIMPLKVLYHTKDGCAGSFADVADAITYAADHGADVISMSLGSTRSDSTVSRALEYAWGKGVLLVGAAGNGGPCTDCVVFPARHPRVTAVTAVDEEGSLASFSSTGPEAELAAPGVRVLSTVPGDAYEAWSGTSMATPHVAGTAALTLAVDSNLSNQELRDHLNATAEDLGLPGNEQGHGGVDAGNSLAALQASNEAPRAEFTTSCTGLNCTFDAGNSTDPDGSLASYTWDLGDGTQATGQVVDHTYASNGTYTVTLTVTDDEDATDTASANVTVESASSPANEPPTAAFTHTCDGRTCTFDASGSSDADGNITSYAWNLGDGAHRQGRVIEHTYDEGGTYTVRLTVTDDDGATDRTEQDVHVESTLIHRILRLLR